MAKSATQTLGNLNAETVPAPANKDVGGYYTFQVTGTWVGTITPKGSIDGANFVSLLVDNLTDGSQTSSITANGIYRVLASGLEQIKQVMSAYTSGSASICDSRTLG